MKIEEMTGNELWAALDAARVADEDFSLSVHIPISPEDCTKMDTLSAKVEELTAEIGRRMSIGAVPDAGTM